MRDLPIEMRKQLVDILDRLGVAAKDQARLEYAENAEFEEVDDDDLDDDLTDAEKMAELEDFGS